MRLEWVGGLGSLLSACRRADKPGHPAEPHISLTLPSFLFFALSVAGTPDDEPAPAGLTAHRISPDGPPAATPQQQQQGGGGGRVRQATLLLPKP